MVKLKKITFLLVCLSLILGLSLSLSNSYALAQGNLPPRPGGGSSGGGGGGGGSGGGGDDDSGPILGDITGQVTDLSTGEPGRGLTVIINDIPIRTDTSGHYSLTGIDDGEYNVDLRLPDEFTPAQESQTVWVENRNKVEVELEYYSQDPPPATPEPESQAGNFVPPEEIPELGASLEDLRLMQRQADETAPAAPAVDAGAKEADQDTQPISDAPAVEAQQPVAPAGPAAAPPAAGPTPPFWANWPGEVVGIVVVLGGFVLWAFRKNLQFEL